jgi:uncharacterized membrane protein HdeD (DUF308 family)
MRWGYSRGMTTEATESSGLSKQLVQNKGWLIAGGILSILVGFAAIAFPYLFSIVISQLIGAFALVNGVIALFLAIFGKETHNRILQGIFALIRIAAGIVLLIFVMPGVAAVTLVIAAFLLTEGVCCLVGGFQMRQKPGWFWVVLNGVAAIVLGLMIWAKWPNDSVWVIGLLYGINSLFAGMSLLMLGFGAKALAAPAKSA